MAIWSTKTNLVWVDIWPFLYLRIIRKPFSLQDSGKGCVTQRQHKLIKMRSPSLITSFVIHNFFIILSSRHPRLLLGNSFACAYTHGQVTLNQYTCLILVQCTKIRVGNCTKIGNFAEPHICRDCVEPHISTILYELSWYHTHCRACHDCWACLDQTISCHRISARIRGRRSWHANSGCV